jgi:hypothetical protein
MKTRTAQRGFALLMLSTLSPLESADALTDGELIDQYAPRFYFSLDNRWCFPVSPFDKKGVCDNDKSALYSAPTYATVTKCGPGVHKISYYLYWGKQNAACGPVTAHLHDWEHVTVHVLNDAVEAVTYYQHKGWYTYGPIDMESPTSPKVYVGEWGHGMYHDKRGEGGGGCSQTGYWQDTRRNEYALNPGERLIDIKTLEKSQKAQLSNKEWGKATPPLVFEKDNNLCSLPPCKADGCDRRWPYGRPSALTREGL